VLGVYTKICQAYFILAHIDPVKNLLYMTLRSDFINSVTNDSLWKKNCSWYKIYRAL